MISSMDGGLRAVVRHVWFGTLLTIREIMLPGRMSRGFEDHDPIGVGDGWFETSVSIRSGAGKRPQGGRWGGMGAAAWGRAIPALDCR